MTISAKVERQEKLRAKLMALAGQQNVKVIAAANQKNADEFEAKVRSIIPRGDPEGGHLADSLAQGHPTATGTSVSVGGPGFPYPLHLETGHRARDGSHVPGKGYWFPAVIVTRKRSRGRVMRAERAVIKSIAGR